MRALTPFWRTLALALAVNLRAKLKFVLLTVLISISTLVFLSVSELSNVSTSNLDRAIDSDLGVAGTYRIEPTPDLGLPPAEMLSTVRAVASRYGNQPIQVAVRFPSVRPECPPYNQIGVVTAAVLLDANGLPSPFRGGSLRSEADLCLSGLVVPRSSVREATSYETKAFDASVIIDPTYQQVLRLSFPEPPRYTIIITTGKSKDESAEIRSAITASFAQAAARSSITADDAAVVSRADSGDSVRSATDGIRLVYGLIGWGVLFVGGIGILIAELIVLRDRTWFFGLARAVGAKRWGVAWLVIADILIVLLAGLMLSAIVLVATQPFVSSFGRTAFQVDLKILRTSALPGLFGGLLLVLALGGAYPAWLASRLDPIDVLERRS